MKAPFEFGLRFFLRVLLPGAVLAIALFPGLARLLDAVSVSTDPLLVLGIAAILSGWLVSVLDMPIYMLYEGRRYWPRLLSDLGRKRQDRRLQDLKRRAFESADREERREAGTELRQSFPFDDHGNFRAAYPTRLGNLVTAFESYTDRVYGFSSVFAWYRIWLSVDKDIREEIDGQQALADSAVYVSFALVVASALAVIYALARLAGVALQPAAAWWVFLAAAAAALALSYGAYRSAMQVLGVFGRLYMAMFDVFAPKVGFPEIEDDVERILQGRKIAADRRKTKNAMIVDYMLSSRVTSPLTGRRVWVGAWNEALEKAQRTGSAARFGILRGDCAIWCAGTADAPHPTFEVPLENGAPGVCPSCRRRFRLQVEADA
ncbi:MAG: hypothetical protein U1E53_27115 [Dongiaceae bacterium]